MQCVEGLQAFVCVREKYVHTEWEKKWKRGGNIAEHFCLSDLPQAYKNTKDR